MREQLCLSQVSVLVRPGQYKITETIHILKDCEVDIVGDVRNKHEEVTFTCTGTTSVRVTMYIL